MLDHFPLEIFFWRSDFERSSLRASRRIDRCERHFVSAVLPQTPDRIAVVAVQRNKRRGHVGHREIALMQRLSLIFEEPMT